MNITCHTIERDGLTLDVLEDAGAGLRIMVSRLGAEMVSLAKRDANGRWIGFLYRDGEVAQPASGWANHATVMGYFIHRLVGERTVYRGVEMLGGTHSFLRHKTFTAPEVATGRAASLTYRIEPNQILAHEYPLRVSLKLTYAMINGRLEVSFRFENQEPDLTAHVSFGLHPGFAVTSLETCTVILPAGSYVRHLAPGNFLSGEVQQFDHETGPMSFAKADLPGSFLFALKDVPVPIFELRDARRRVDLDFREAPYVTFWSDGNPYLCVEPCWGLPDHHRQRPFESKLGIEEIEPRASLVRRFSITPHLL